MAKAKPRPLSMREIILEQELEREVREATARILKAVRKAFAKLARYDGTEKR